MARFITLTFEGHVKRWYHTLSAALIHSFDQLVKELHKEFDMYDYQDVLKRINQLIMKPNESIKDLYDHFLNLCYEFPEENMDWDFFKQNFKCLVHMYLHGESKPADVSSSQTPINRHNPLIL